MQHLIAISVYIGPKQHWRFLGLRSKLILYRGTVKVSTFKPPVHTREFWSDSSVEAWCGFKTISETGNLESD